NVTLAVALLFVDQHVANIPLWDEWSWLDVLSGEKPATPEWLWKPQSEHRVPLPKLVLVAGLRVTGGDFRLGMFGNVLLLGALALAMTLAAWRLRGRMSYTDAFFPLVILSPAQHQNWMNFISVHPILTTILAGVVLLIMARRGMHLTLGAGIL